MIHNGEIGRLTKGGVDNQSKMNYIDKVSPLAEIISLGANIITIRLSTLKIVSKLVFPFIYFPSPVHTHSRRFSKSRTA